MPGSNSVKKVEWYGHVIYLYEEYYVYFGDKKREMTEKQLERYNYINTVFPAGKPRWVQLAEMDPRDNPNVTPMLGWELIRLGEAGYIPIFDKFFSGKYETRRLSMVSPDGMEYFLEQSLIRS